MQRKVYTTDLEDIQVNLSQIVSVLQLAYGTVEEETEAYSHTLPGVMEASINAVGLSIEALNRVLDEIKATLEEDTK